MSFWCNQWRRQRRRRVDDIELRAARAERLVQDHVPQTAFDLDEDLFSKNLRSLKKGAASGPSGMTTDHLRPLLLDHRGLHLFFQMSERLARAEVPEAVVNIVRMGRLTALSKPDGGVRGA